MINVDSLITDLKCLGEVAETEDIRVEGNPLHGWANEAWQALESLQQQLADTQRKLEEHNALLQSCSTAMKNSSGYTDWSLMVEAIDRAIEQSKGGDDD